MSVNQRFDRVLDQCRVVLLARWETERAAINTDLNEGGVQLLSLPAFDAAQVDLRAQAAHAPTPTSYPQIRIVPVSSTQSLLGGARRGAAIFAVEIVCLISSANLSIHSTLAARTEYAVMRGGYAMAECAQRCLGAVKQAGDALATVMGEFGVSDIEAVTGLHEIHQVGAPMGSQETLAISVSTTYLFTMRKQF